METLADYRRDDIKRKVNIMGALPLDVMLIGGTGSGKSTTLNSIFQRKVAKVGESYEPETMNVSEHLLHDYFRLWDTPGLGDGVERDKLHARNIINQLYATFSRDGTKYGLIDLVLIVIDGSSRDMGTTYTLLNNVVVPNISPDRILTAINQCDIAMSGHHWDNVNNKPDPTLAAFLDDKAASITRRVREATGITLITPVCYSAEKNYNITKVLDLIIDHIPAQLRTPERINIDAKALAKSVDDAIDKITDALGNITSRALHDLMHNGSDWLSGDFHDAMSDSLTKSVMLWRSSTTHFLLCTVQSTAQAAHSGGTQGTRPHVNSLKVSATWAMHYSTRQTL